MATIGRDRRVVAGHRNQRLVGSSFTLAVPACSEAVGIVRLVLMSSCANTGIGVAEIFEVSHEVSETFANVLVAEPDASQIVVHAEASGRAFDVVPVI